MEKQALRVLLVEDEASLREPLARHLYDQFGYEVTVAADVAFAWRLVCEAAQPYDVALLDDLLVPEPGAEPELLGIELLQKIKTSQLKTECVVFTGWGMGRALEALQAGAYCYLEKPVRLEELGITIRLAAEQARLRRERDLLSTTLEISEALLGELDLQKTLEVIAEAVSRLVGAEACTVAYREPSTGAIRYEPTILLGDPSIVWRRHLRHTRLTQQIIETGETFAIADVHKALDQVDENLYRAGTRSLIGLPIPGEPEPVGVLYAYSTQPERFGTRQRRLLLLIAQQAAIALKNARLFAESQKTARRMQALYETTRALSSNLEEDQVIRDILLAVYRALDCEHVLLSTVDETTRTIGIRHGIWQGQFDVFPEWMRMSRYSLDDPDILTDIYQTGRTEIIGAWDDRFNRAIWEKFGHERFVRIFAPIKMGDRITGIVEVGYDRCEKGRIQEDEVEALTAFMEQAAVALDKARLYEEARTRAHNLETLQDLAMAVNSSLDLEETLQRACQAAVEFLGVDHSGLVLFEPDYTQGIVKAEYPALGPLNEIIPLRGVPAEETLIETREPLMIANVSKDESLGSVQEILCRFDIQSILIVPVISKNGRLLGSFSLDAVGHRRTFTAQEVDLCQVFAAHVAVAIENARLFSELSEAQEWREALIDVTKVITSTLDWRQVLDQVVESALDAFPKARNGAIHLYDPQAGVLKLVASAYPSSLEIADVLGFGSGEGIAGWVYEKRGPAVVTNAHSDPRYKQADHPRARVHKSLICVPLQVRGQVIGTLTLDNDQEFGAFRAEDASLVSTFADQAAIAIDNARHYRQAQEGRQYIRSLYQASNTLLSPQEPLQVLHDIVEQACLAADAAWASVILVDKRGQAQCLVTARIDKEFDIENTIRPNGITMQVMRTGRAVVLEDTHKARDRVNPSVFRNGVAAAVCLPLSLQDRCIGVIWIHYSEPRRFEAYEIDALGLYANQASVAYDSARRMQELEQMREAAEAMSRSLEPQQALQQIAASAAQILQANSVVIWSYDSVRHEFIPEELTAVGMQWDELQEFKKTEPKPGGTAHTIMRQRHVTVPDVSDSGIGFMGASTRGLLEHVGVQSFQGICLRVGDENLGVLYVNYSRPRSFGEDELQTLRTFAGHASLALKNARLLAQMERTREAARLIAGVTVQEDLKQTLRAIAHNTQQALRCAAVTLYSYDQATERFGEWAAVIPNARSPGTARLPKELPPRSAVGTVLNLGGPDYYHLAEDDAQDDTLLDGSFVRAEGIKAAIGVQLRVSECKVGVMFVNYRSPHRFTSDEIATIQLFADQAAVAIRNAQLYQAEQQHMQALSAIQETSAAVSAVLEPDKLLPIITERAAQIFAAPATGLMLWNRSRDALVIQAGFGLSDRYRQEQEIDQATVGTLVKLHGFGPITFDIGSDPIGKPELVAAEGLSNVLVSSLTIGRELIGILNIYAKGKPRQFSEREMELAEIFANHAAIAIHNARLFERASERSNALSALYEAGKAVTSTLALDEILKQIAEQAYRLTSLHGEPARFSLISLVEGHKLRFAETYPCVHLERLLNQVGEMDLERDERVGVMGRAVNTRRSQWVPDVTQDPDYVVYDAQIRSELAVPIYIEDQVIGVINVEHTEPDALGKAEQSTLESLAMQAATAIRHAQRSELQQAVYEASKAIATRIDIEQQELLTCILEHAFKRIRWPHRPKAALGIIQLHDPGSGELLLESVYPPEQYPALVRRIGERRSLDGLKNPDGRAGINSRAILEGKIQRVPDVRFDADYVELYPGTRSELDAPLRVGDQIVGVLGLESDRLAAFDKIDAEALQSLADLAALVIQNARLYRENQQRVEELQGLNEIAQSIQTLTMTHKVYRHVNESIAQLLGAEMCAVLLYDQNEEALLCQAPMYGVPDDIAPRYRISVGKESLVGDIWRAQSHLILNGVQQNPLIAALGLGDLAAEAGLRDTLLAKLTVANHDLGVIQASNRLDGAPFSEDDARLLSIFAAQAAAVIENARLYEELRTAKGLVGARTALAWMGMANNAWRHSIEGHAINIRNAITLLRSALDDHSTNLNRRAIELKLALVDRLAQQILDKPITPPLSSEEGIEEINVNDLISERIDQLWENESYHAVTPRLHLGSDANLGVRVSPEWLRRAFDLLVDNAVAAMVGSPNPELKISTRLVNSEVEIALQDRGSGIPSSVLPRLFREQIESEDGLGMGLMMVQAILHTYGGDVCVGRTGPQGTTMLVTLPVAQQDKTNSELDL